MLNRKQQQYLSDEEMPNPTPTNCIISIGLSLKGKEDRKVSDKWQ
jgi:hypothetical protein